MSETPSDRYKRFPRRLLVEVQEQEERGIFVYHEDVGWWRFAETHTNPQRAQQRFRELADGGETVVLAKREVVRSPWSLISQTGRGV